MAAGGRVVQITKSINHNAAIGIDSLGREVVVLGSGVGFGTIPRDIPLAQIDRTFVGIDPKYLGLIEELPQEHLEFAAQFADIVRMQVSHELSPNLVVTLADHISFMVRRAKQGIYVAMPLAYDVQQDYPVEYRLGQMCVRGVEKTFHVRLPKNEAVGVALSIVNSAMRSSSVSTRAAERDERAIERATRIVEKELGISVDRDSFDFARFATHVKYLIDRLVSGEPIATPNDSLYDEIVAEFPQVANCAGKVAQSIARSDEGEVTREEKLYLMLHINRLAERAAGK